MTTTDVSQFSKLLDVLNFRDDERLSIGIQQPGVKFNGEPKPIMWFGGTRTQGEAYVAGYCSTKPHNVWFTINPTTPPPGHYGRGTVEHVTRLASLWCELDVKPSGLTAEAVGGVIDGVSAVLGEYPVALVESGGGGQHPYWGLDPDDPEFVLDTPAKRVAAVAFMRRFGRLVAHVAEMHGGAVDSVFDITRVLRVPGTFNHKYGAPRPVTLSLGNGGPMTAEQVREAFDAHGIREFAEDRKTVGDAVSPPEEWRFGDETTAYVKAMIEGWRNDRPPGGRHQWLLGKCVRLAAAHRTGRISEDDHTRAAVLLAERFEWLVEHHGDRRKVGPGEILSAYNYAIGVVAAKTDEEARAEVGRDSGDGPFGMGGESTEGSAGEAGHSGESTDSGRGTGDGARQSGGSATDAADGDGVFFDVGQFFDGGMPAPPRTEVALRTDGIGLLYRGAHNSLLGDPECGKTLLLDHVTVEELAVGGRVLRVDLDHNGPRATLARLIALGASEAELRDPSRFLYVEPDDADHVRTVVGRMREWSPTFVVLDSIGELMPMFGFDANSDKDFTLVNNEIIRPLVTPDCCVVSVDHLAKNEASRKYGATGAVGKKRAADGAYLRVEVDEPFKRGEPGSAYIYVEKDRHGGLRENCPPADSKRHQLAGKFILAPVEGGGGARGSLLAPKDCADPLDTTAAQGKRRQREIDEAVQAAILNEVCSAILANVPLSCSLANDAGKAAIAAVIAEVRRSTSEVLTAAKVGDHRDRLVRDGLLVDREFKDLPAPSRRKQEQGRGRYLRPAPAYPAISMPGVERVISAEQWTEIVGPALAHLDCSTASGGV